MSADDKAPPSATKLRQLREKGSLPTSVFATQAIGLVCLAFLLKVLGPRSMSLWSELWTYAREENAAALVPKLRWLFAGSVALLTLCGMSALLLQIVQSRGYMQIPKLSFARLKPFSSYSSRFSAEARWTILSQLLSLAAPIFVASQVCQHLLRSFARAWMSDTPAARRLDWLWGTSGPEFQRLLATLALSFTAAGILDWILRRRAFLRKHGMDVQEQKQEYKNQEGGPEKQQAQAERRIEILFGPPAKAMRAADVVVRNPTHVAVAIAGAFSNDPWVLMVGRGQAARRVLRLARRYGRPQVRSVQLARALAKAGEGADVPPALIAAVTEAAYWAHGLQAPSDPEHPGDQSSSGATSR